jgi:hypothetical protein
MRCVREADPGAQSRYAATLPNEAHGNANAGDANALRCAGDQRQRDPAVLLQGYLREHASGPPEIIPDVVVAQR